VNRFWGPRRGGWVPKCNPKKHHLRRALVGHILVPNPLGAGPMTMLGVASQLNEKSVSAHNGFRVACATQLLTKSGTLPPPNSDSDRGFGWRTVPAPRCHSESGPKGRRQQTPLFAISCLAFLATQGVLATTSARMKNMRRPGGPGLRCGFRDGSKNKPSRLNT